MRAKERNNLTEGSVLKSLIALSVPIILANILQTAYQLTDTFWVGRLGAVAVAAVSISFPIIFFIISLGGSLAVAGTILVAQYKGKGDKKTINHIASQTLVAVIVIATVLAAVGYFFSPILINLVGSGPDVFSDAVAYIKISFIGMIFMFIYMVFQSLMRGVGDVKTPMYIVLGTVLLNLILDPLFIFGYGFIPALGVTGAAVATIGTQGLAAIIGITLLLKGRHQIQLQSSGLKPDIPLLKKMFKLGFPSSIEQSMRSLGWIVIIFLAAKFGTSILAAYGIGNRILSFILMPALGLSIASSTLVGQNIGAGKIKRAEKIIRISSLVAFVVLTIIGVIVFLFAKQIATSFVPGEQETIEASALFIKMMAITFNLIGIEMILDGAFRGSGKTMTPMVFSLISLWGLRLPLTYFLSRHTSLAEVGIWIAFPIAEVITTVLTIVWFSRGTWKKKKIMEEMKFVERSG